MKIPAGLLSVGAGLILLLSRAVPRGGLPRRGLLAFALLMGAFMAGIPSAVAGGGEVVWIRGYNGPANAYDTSKAMVVDGNSNVIVTGYRARTIGTNLTEDFTTIKYSNAGVALWTNVYHGPSEIENSARAIAVDANGNVFVTGWSYGTNSLPEFATLAYSAAGVPLWTNLFHGAGQGYDYVSGIAVDKNGNAFVAGYSEDTNAQPSFTTIKYSLAGVAQWTNHFTGAGHFADYAYGVGTDTNGNVYVTGQSGGEVGYDFATIKYSGAGVALWTNVYNSGSNNDDEAHYLVVGKNGNVIVSGYSQGSGFDFATIAYTGAGMPLWTNRYSGPGAGDDFVEGIAVDASGNVFVTGDSQGTNGFYDYATVGYSGAGVALWTNRFHGQKLDDDSEPDGIATDSGGNVFVTGFATTTNGYADMVTIAYSGTSIPLWTNNFNSATNGDDAGVAVASDAAGNVFVTGGQSGISGDFLTIKYSPTTAILPGVHLTIESDGASGYYIRFNGSPRATYRLQRAAKVTGPWVLTAPQTAPDSGQVVFWDFLPPMGQGFYRVSQP